MTEHQEVLKLVLRDAGGGNVFSTVVNSRYATCVVLLGADPC